MAKTILVRSGLQKIGFTKNAETGIMQICIPPIIFPAAKLQSCKQFLKKILSFGY